MIVCSGVLSVISAVPTAPTNLTYSVSAGSIKLSWAASYTGWILQSQTNGLTGTWVDVAGSASVDTLTIPIGASNSVFFRMRYP
jgi:uncharacterized protein YceK